jgi:hypothetical protein
VPPRTPGDGERLRPADSGADEARGHRGGAVVVN